MWAHQMHVQDYQDLIDRGWRRSGKYCYKPTMNRTCCPMYTIKCDTSNFKLSRSQKKVLKRVNRFLITGKMEDVEDKTVQEEDLNCGKEKMSGEGDVRNMESMLAEKMKPSSVDVSFDSGTQEKFNSPGEKMSSSEEPLKSARKEMLPTNSISQTQQALKRQPPKQGAGADPNKPVCRKAKELRAERRQKKLAANPEKASKEAVTPKNAPKTLEDLLSEPENAPDCAHKLELRLVRSSPRSEEFVSSFHSTHQVYHRYQTVIHKDPPSKPNQSQFTRFLCDSPLGSSFNGSHSVYSRYQMTIHGDSLEECNQENFEGFLVHSPLKELHKDGGPSMGYGSFHQHYLLDGKLIAVGVIDILPTCVSSVYLYYDPDYSFMTLGVYSALREIAFIRELSRHSPALQFYYMGFYIHSCSKMRYKVQYSPSFLACPETYAWIPVELCTPKLDISKYSRLQTDGEEDKDKVEDVSKVLILHKGKAMPYTIYTMLTKGHKADAGEVTEYANFVGKTCAQRMLLVRA